MTTPKQKEIDDQLSKQIVDEMLAMPEEELKGIVRKRMGKINLSDLEAKANKATCGPWHIDRRNDDDTEIIYVNHIKDHMGNPVGICRTYQIVGDGEFIASMNPTTALALIRVARAARALVASGMYQGLFHDNLEEALKEINL